MAPSVLTARTVCRAAAFAICAAGACILAAAGCDGSADKAAQQANDLKEVRAEQDKLVRELADATAKITGLNAQVKDLSSKNESLGVEKELLEREATHLNERIRTLNEELEDLARRTAQRPEATAAQAASAAQPEVQKAIERLDALSQALFERGDLDAALSVAVTGESLGAESPELLYRAAFCKASARDYAGAAGYYARAWKGLGDDADAAFRVKVLTNWGAALARTGDTAGAADRYRQALKIDETFAPAWFDLGLIYAADPQRAGDAIEAFRNHIIHGGDRGVTARRQIADLQAEQANEAK